MYSRCAGVKKMTARLSRNDDCRKCDENNGEVVEQEERLHDEVETVMEFTYLGDKVSADGGHEAAMTAKTGGLGLGGVVSCCMEGCLAKLKRAVHKSYVRPAIRHRSETW